MSWNIKLVGYRSAVKREIQDQVHMPAGIKQTIIDICDEPLPHHNGVIVKGCGHSGGGFGNVELHVEGINISELPPSAVPAGCRVENGVVVGDGQTPAV